MNKLGIRKEEGNGKAPKEGLDYFPLDVDIDQDDKMVLIEATHGLAGFAVVIKLYMKIYKNGYFYEWTEKEQLLFSKRLNIPLKNLSAIIDECLKWDLFDKAIYKVHHVLTSSGIQRRYVEAKSKKKSLKLVSEYLLVDIDELLAVNSEITLINSETSTQSKVKESKGKKNNRVPVNSEELKTPESLNYQAVVDKYHELCPGLPKIREVTNSRKSTLKNWGNIDEMIEVFDRTGKSDFLNGSTEWKANFDWIIKSANRVKILEGNYDNRQKQKEAPIIPFLNLTEEAYE